MYLTAVVAKKDIPGWWGKAPVEPPSSQFEDLKHPLSGT
jgi:hypothetical protein